MDQDLRDASKVIQQSAVNNAQALGLSATAIPADGVIPTQQHVNFAIAKTDYQLSPEHKLSARYFFFKNKSPYNIGGGLNTVERATDFNDRMDSASVQLISSFGANRLNELRVQFARRHQFRTTSENAGACPAIVVSGIANFGCPLDATQSAGFDFSQKIWQVSDNFTWIRGQAQRQGRLRPAVRGRRPREHAAADLHLPERRRLPRGEERGPTRAPTPPSSRTSAIRASATTRASTALFVQDDFRVSSSFKLLFGLRYDLFDIPDSRPFAQNPLSQSFKKDKNNFAPARGLLLEPGRGLADGRCAPPPGSCTSRRS